MDDKIRLLQLRRGLFPNLLETEFLQRSRNFLKLQENNFRLVFSIIRQTSAGHNSIGKATNIQVMAARSGKACNPSFAGNPIIASVRVCIPSIKLC